VGKDSEESCDLGNERNESGNGYQQRTAGRGKWEKKLKRRCTPYKTKERESVRESYFL
jgi:hypothetical protein